MYTTKRGRPIVEATPTPMTDLLATAWVSPPARPISWRRLSGGGRGSLEAPLWIDRLRRRSLPIKRDGPIVEAIPTPMTDLLATAWVSPPGTTDLLATAVGGVCVRVFGLGPVPLGDGLNWGSVSRRRFSLPSLGDGSRPP